MTPSIVTDNASRLQGMGDVENQVFDQDVTLSTWSPAVCKVQECNANLQGRSIWWEIQTRRSVKAHPLLYPLLHCDFSPPLKWKNRDYWHNQKWISISKYKKSLENMKFTTIHANPPVRASSSDVSQNHLKTWNPKSALVLYHVRSSPKTSPWGRLARYPTFGIGSSSLSISLS